MMTIGKTRYGNVIWMDWTEDLKDKLIAKFQNFHLIEEKYDAYAAFDAQAVREKRRNDATIFARIYEMAVSHYETMILAVTDIESLDKSMGFKSSCERANYGRSLLNPEFQD